MLVLLASVLISSRTTTSVELRPIDQDHDQHWSHAHDVAGTDHHFGAVVRNTNKNRAWRNPPSSVRSLTFEQFLDLVRSQDAAAGLNPGVQRPSLQGNAHALAELAAGENHIVSVTGYLIYGYAGPPEACEYQSSRYHDWHLELFKNRFAHEPRPGDLTPIVCEVTRFTERELYDAGVRLQDLLCYSRYGGNGHIHYVPTGHRAHKVRITGYLLWDDEHNKASDSGPKVLNAPPNGFHNPWRQTPWEIHPILKIEDLGA